MAFLGRFQLGQTVPFFLVTKDVNKTPQVPNAPPILTVWSPSAKLVVAEMPILEKYTQTGNFLSNLFLSSLFSTGLYQASYYYEIGNFQGIEADNFEIMAGGDADGTINSMYFYRRPHGKFVMQSLNSGKIIAGRNPTI